MKKSLRLTALFLTIVLLALTLSACGSSDSAKDFSNDYDPETDFQFTLEYDDIGISYITEAPDGYYFLNESFIYYLDKKTMEAMPLCKKPDCLHDDYSRDSLRNDPEVSCEAFVGGSGNLGNSIFYYDNAIYVLTEKNINNEFRPKYVLVKYALDGTLLEDFYIFPGIPQTSIRHRDMIYYTYPSITIEDGGNVRTAFTLMSVSLKDKTETELLTDPLYNDNCSLDKLFAYGKYVYIYDYGFKEPPTDENDISGYIEQLLVYDTETGEVSTMETVGERASLSVPLLCKDGLMHRFWYNENEDWYNDTDERNKQYYKTKLSGEDPEKFFTSAEPRTRLIWDGTYYYEDNENDCATAQSRGNDPIARKILVYNDAFEVVETITLENVDNNPEKTDFSCNGYKCVAASEDYLFIKTGSSNENYSVYYYNLIAVDKKQIGTGNVVPFLVWSDVIENEGTYSE